MNVGFRKKLVYEERQKEEVRRSVLNELSRAIPESEEAKCCAGFDECSMDYKDSDVVDALHNMIEKDTAVCNMQPRATNKFEISDDKSFQETTKSENLIDLFSDGDTFTDYRGVNINSDLFLE